MVERSMDRYKSGKIYYTSWGISLKSIHNVAHAMRREPHSQRWFQIWLVTIGLQRHA